MKEKQADVRLHLPVIDYAECKIKPESLGLLRAAGSRIGAVAS